MRCNPLPLFSPRSSHVVCRFRKLKVLNIFWAIRTRPDSAVANQDIGYCPPCKPSPGAEWKRGRANRFSGTRQKKSKRLRSCCFCCILLIKVTKKSYRFLPFVLHPLLRFFFPFLIAANTTANPLKPASARWWCASCVVQTLPHNFEPQQTSEVIKKKKIIRIRGPGHVLRFGLHRPLPSELSNRNDTYT